MTDNRYDAQAIQRVAGFLDRFRNGDCEAAFFGLIESGRETLPILMEAFHAETDRKVRDFLVEVIWQHRDESAIPFLASVLNDSEPAVWKQAIDGLVTLASVEAANALRAARSRQFARKADRDEFQQWIDEAIEQVNNQKPDGHAVRAGDT